MPDEVMETAESSVVKMIGEAYSGVASAPVGPTAAPAEPAEPEVVEPFDFEGPFQTKVLSLAVRDGEFMRRSGHLLRPEYFTDAGEAALINIVIGYHDKYRCLPDRTTLVRLFRSNVAAKIIRGETVEMAKAAIKNALQAEIRDREYVEEQIVEFAKRQAMTAAILKAADLVGKGKMGPIEALVKEALNIGINEEGDAYDFWGRIETRSEVRADAKAGLRPPRGITTGVPKLDELLYHRGWGRRELTSIMGGAKAGKTTALINFAKSASLAGYNVLYVSLEVGTGIIADRADASIASVLMKELVNSFKDVEEKIKDIGRKAGKFILHEYPSGTLTPNMLRRLLERYRSPGRTSDGRPRDPIKFDLIVVDYADIMAPNFRTTDPIENSKSVYVDLRAIAYEEDAAVLTATQTNREGFKATVAKAEHVAEDFNKVRTVDLMISINKTEEEARDGEARLYFAASRNQESGFTIVVKQNLAMMQFIQSVLRVE